MNSNRNLYRYLGKLFQKNWKKTLLYLGLIVLVTVLEMCLPILTRDIMDRGIGQRDTSLLISLTAAFMGISLAAAAMNLGMNLLKNSIRKSYSANLKVRILKHLARLDGEFFSNQHTGDLFKTLDGDLYVVESFGVDSVITVAVAGMKALVSLVILMRMNFPLLAVVLFIQSCMMLVQRKVNAWSSKNIREVRTLAGKLANQNEAYISNLMNLVVTKGKQALLNQYIKNERAYAKKCVRTDFILEISQVSFYILANLVTAATYLLGGPSVIGGTMTVGEIMAFMQYTAFLIGPIRSIVSMNNQIQQTKVSLDRIKNLLNLPVKISQNNKGRKLPSKLQSLCFSNVRFSYGSKEVLKGVCFTLRPGKVYGFMGSSGGGKTTIINLLYRLWDPEGGKILLNEIPIDRYNLKAYRKLFSVVPQENCLLDDTVFQNICWGFPRSRAEVEKICQAVELTEWLSTLETGLDTIIGENGVKLSGGQKQRIGIARALLSPAPVLILDEATSAVDNLTQSRIWEQITPYFKDKIVIMIAHRMETIQKADYLYLLEGGVIGEEGTPKDLEKQKGSYWRQLAG